MTEEQLDEIIGSSPEHIRTCPVAKCKWQSRAYYDARVVREVFARHYLWAHNTVVKAGQA